LRAPIASPLKSKCRLTRRSRRIASGVRGPQVPGSDSVSGHQGGDVMRRRASLLWTLCLLLPLVAACDRNESRDGTALESPRAGDQQKSSLVLVCYIDTVDTERQTLIVAFGD